MAPRQRKQISINLLVPFIVIVLVFSGMMWQKYRNSQSVPILPPAQQQATGKRTVVLFFVSDGTFLAREAREVEGCSDNTSCLRAVLDELLAGPLGDFEEALPEGTLVNSVRIDGPLAVIDLNRTFAEGLPSGSSAETLAVYSIVNTIIANFPVLKLVKVTIEGDHKVVLRHLDLTEPLSADMTLEQTTPPEAPTVVAPAPSRTSKGTP